MAQLGRLNDLFLSGRGVVLYHRFLKHSQYQPYDKLVEFQVAKLRNILISAYEKTQYYHDLFLKSDFNPYRDFNEIADIERVPVLEQSTARQNKDRIVDGTKLEKAVELRTSGTTGEPFITFASRPHWIMEQAVTWRHWKWAGYRFRDKMAIVRSYVPKEGQPIWKIDSARNFYFLSAYHISESNIDLYVDKLRQWKPKFLRGYPCSLYLLAKFMQLKSLTIDPPKAVLTASEMLLPQYRRTIEQTFAAPVFDWYGLGEPAVTMSECEAHEGLHINMEYGLCELIEDPQLADNQRRIVATSLLNDVMPLIRYETKDIAVVNFDRTCCCGRKLPLVKGILGRSDDFLYGSEGRVLPGVNFYTLFYNFPELTGFQIIQDGLSNIEVRVTHPQTLTEGRRSQLLGELENRIGRSVKVRLVENEGFVQTGEGKKPVIIQRFDGVRI